MSLPSNKSVYYHADKEIFYTIFVNEYFRIAKAYPQSRPSMKNFVPPPTYQTSRNLFDPTVNYRTIGPYLQSKHHQCRSLFLSRRGTQSEKVSHLKLPLKTSSDIQQKHNASLMLRRVLIRFEATNQARSFCVAIDCNPHQTVLSLLILYTSQNKVEGFPHSIP